MSVETLVLTSIKVNIKQLQAFINIKNINDIDLKGHAVVYESGTGRR